MSARQSAQAHTFFMQGVNSMDPQWWPQIDEVTKMGIFRETLGLPYGMSRHEIPLLEIEGNHQKIDFLSPVSVTSLPSHHIV